MNKLNQTLSNNVYVRLFDVYVLLPKETVFSFQNVSILFYYMFFTDFNFSETGVKCRKHLTVV